MIGLIVLVSIAAWIFLGYFIWRRLICPRIHSWLARVAVLLPLLAVWLIAPVADEILGAREFEKLCKEMPEIKFHGPVPVGPGAFFEADGTPKWKDRNQLGNSDDFSAIQRNTRAFDDIFKSSPGEWRLLREWPMPIGELHSLYTDKRTGKPVLESYARYSPGGWIKRGIGWGNHAPYQCPRKGRFPRDEEWIVFSKETPIKSTGNGEKK